MTATPARPPQLTDWHLAGQAVVYMRQSSMQQVRENTGSTMHQRSQVELLRAMGFPESRIRVIDEDLGQSGTSTKNRTGLQSLTQDILAGAVRVVAVSEISRLGRDEVELVKFLWLCELKRVLLLENGVPRDLHEIGDWTLVQIQAILARQENRRKTQRSMTGRLAKARTGIPVTQLPCGFERGPNGEAMKTADPAVREVLERVWREALLRRTPGDIAKGLRADGLRLPANDARGHIRWAPPNRGGIFRILYNPLYAGFLVLWRHRTERGPDGKHIRPTRPDEQQWLPGKVEAYVSPEEYQRVQDLMAARHFPGRTWVGDGAALCPGLVSCGRDGRQLHVVYESVKRHRPPHQARCYYYVCRGDSADRNPGPLCMTVSGRMLDQAIEEIVLAELRCPSPANLRRAIQEENERRQATGRLLAAKVRRAQAAVAEARARLEESRQRGRNPHVTQLYEDELEQAICLLHKAERQANTSPNPTLIDSSPAFLAQMAAVFQEFPRLWQSGDLGPRDRKEVVRRVVARIDILEKGESTRVQVTLHGGQVLGRALFGEAGRRRLIKSLHAEGRDPEAIAAELGQRGILNKYGQPFTAAVVRRSLRRWVGPMWGVRPREDRAALDALRALWSAGLYQTEIAARLNTQGFRTGSRKPWTPKAIWTAAKRLRLPRRWEVHREMLRAPITELVGAGWDDAAIARELSARGLKTFSRATWSATAARSARLALGIHRPSGRRGDRQ